MYVEDNENSAYLNSHDIFQINIEEWIKILSNKFIFIYYEDDGKFNRIILELTYHAS